MTFHLGFLTHVHGEGDAGELLNGVVDLFVAAEELGYDSGWVAQHHLQPRYGRLPAPLVLLAGVAARTERIQLGTAVSVLPLEDPLRLAEDAAVLDELSGGRGRDLGPRPGLPAPHRPRRAPRAAHPAGRARPGDHPDRAGRHRDHHLQRAVPHRPQVRLARPPVRRPGRLERRHVGGAARSRQLRPRRAPGALRPLRPRRRVRRGRPRAVGQLRRRRRDPGRRGRPLLRPGRPAPVAGTPEQIADRLQEWFTAGAADGFNVSFPYLPGPAEDFVEQVVPELRKRGLVREDYEGTTLREHLGLARPEVTR
jgi:alkanesulfonate monooxygenase SsuD/methylene tetrahydromethanopterin reductase-like flavin-dependent oxidoreductase (luciferase family)